MRAAAVPISTYSCNVLADACIRCGQPQRALKLYRDFEAGTDRDFPKDDPARQLDVRSFNIMLKAHREMGQLEGALGVLAAIEVRVCLCCVGMGVVRGVRGDRVSTHKNKTINTHNNKKRPAGWSRTW